LARGSLILVIDRRGVAVVADQLKRILIAEDNQALAKITKFSLEVVGFSVTVAPDGLEALEVAQQERFDLIITDYAMPQMTGVDLCRHIRQISRYEDTPIVLTTGFSSSLDLAGLSDELNLSAVVVKPYSPNGLAKTVKGLLANTAE